MDETSNVNRSSVCAIASPAKANTAKNLIAIRAPSLTE
jgi:hypothetical protein